MQSMKSLTEALSVSPHLTMGSIFYLFSSIFFFDEQRGDAAPFFVLAFFSVNKGL
ncbi:hypothetical protein RKD56_001499 [Priestia megaterium]